MAIQQELEGLQLVQIGTGEMLVSDATAVNLDFLTDEEINKLLPVTAKWATKSLSQQIQANNAWSSKLNGSKIMPLATVKGDQALYHHGTYLSTIRCFSPLLQSFSGDGKCVGKFDLTLNSILSYQITINHCPLKEDGEDDASVLKRKQRHLASVMKVITSEGAYEVGKVLPNGTEMFHLEYATGKVPGACTSKGANWSFVVAKKPVISGKSDIEWIGEMATATKARVTLKIPGWFVSQSNAEKFAGVLTKLMLDPIPMAKSLGDLKWGSTLMYETTAGTSIESAVQAILNGNMQPCPHPLVYSGQETSKGAATAPISAAAIHAMTGKYVARKVQLHQQKIKSGGKETLHDVGEVTWDSDSFIKFRYEWNEASIHWAVIAKWIPASLYPVFYESVGNSDIFRFVPYPVNIPAHLTPTGYLVFHKCEVRAELSPLTMETSTVGENNKTDAARGSLFSELIQVISQVGDPVIAKVLYATGWKARKMAQMVIKLGEYKNLTWDDVQEMNLKNKTQITCIDPVNDKFDLPENPQEALNHLSKKVGEVFFVPYSEYDPEGAGCLVSPLLATKLGMAPGSQLNLYAKVMFDIAMLLNSKLELDETTFTKEWLQAMGAHNTVVTQILRGEEVNENVSSVLGDTTRAQFVWSSKVGACIFQGVDPNGLHVSTDHPLASKQGSYHLVWRNPMAFILGLKVIAVGPATEACPNPDIVTEKQILGNNKTYMYPTTWYKTAGDVDGDICQGIDLTWLMSKWVTNTANHAALKAVGVFNQLFKPVA